jgi:hypothetical protein
MIRTDERSRGGATFLLAGQITPSTFETDRLPTLRR